MVVSPDKNALGLIESTPDPLRYDGHTADPDEVAAVLSEMIPRGARVLDVGCGTGSVSRIIAEMRNARVVGIEPDVSRADIAQKRGIDVRVGLLSKDLIDELGTFDVVLFADVLEHLPEPLSLLLLAKHALSPDGAIVASVPNVAHWSIRWDLLRGRFNYRDCGIMDATHLRWFTKRGIELLFKSAECKVEKYQVTAGFTLQVYTECRPWRSFARTRRDELIRHAIRAVPQLFGCQHVVRAVPFLKRATAFDPSRRGA